MKNENENKHWSQQEEQAAGYWQLKFLLILFNLLPVVVMRIIAFPVGFFYFLFSKRGRTESKRFLSTIAPFIKDPKIEKKCRSPFGPLRHIISFSLALIEKIQSWSGKFPFNNIHFKDDDISVLVSELESGRGVFLIFSHLGNAELLRGMLGLDKTGLTKKISVTAIMDLKVTAHFNRMIKELNPQSAMDIISADEIGPHTAVLLEEKIASGGMVLIAGDRTSALGESRKYPIPFFGKEADFSSGIFYMAAMMNAPVYFIFGMRRKDLSLIPEYDMYVHKNNLPFEYSKKERLKNSLILASSFVSLLENYCKEQPFQWYNFFDFWQEGK